MNSLIKSNAFTSEGLQQLKKDRSFVLSIHITNIRITSKHRQSAQIEAERVFNAIATKCDKKQNGFIKKIKSLK